MNMFKSIFKFKKEKKEEDAIHELTEEHYSLKKQVQLLQKQLEQEQKLLGEMAQECDIMRSQLYKPKEYELVDVIAYRGILVYIFHNGESFKYSAESKNLNFNFYCEDEGFVLKENAIDSAKKSIDINKFELIKALRYKNFVIEIESRKATDRFKFLARSDDGYSKICSDDSDILTVFLTLEDAERQAKETIDDLIKRQHEDDLLEADLAAEG
ncbi:MAG: hypothetical protein KatS3mg087_0629 [Patescibacteria group bacterium]|nr:MAG: hypothetical protein KatS3mg087_0629 [Patescibacteria group bacterium]